MTGVISATTFAGLPFCAATFADGNTYCYYNGTLVSDLTAGLIIASLNTNAKIGAAFTSLVNSTTGYTATNVGGGVVNVFNPSNQQGTGYTTSIVDNSTLGTVAGVFTNAGTPAVPQNAAAAAFAITGGSSSPGINTVTGVYAVRPAINTASFHPNGTIVTIVTAANHNIQTGNTVAVVNLSTPAANTGAGYTYLTVTVISPTSFSYANTTGASGVIADTAGLVYVQTPIMTTAVDWQIDNAHTAAAVAAEINTQSTTPDFVASSTGNTVNIYTVEAAAGLYNGALLGVTTNYTGNVCVDNCIFTVYSTITPVTGRIFTNIIVNSLDLLSGYTPGTITSLETAIQDMISYINTQSNTTGFCAFSPTPNAGTASASAVMQLSQNIMQSVDPAISVTIVPVSGITFLLGVANPLLALATPAIVYLTNTRRGSINQGTATLSCTVIGGVPPYTHSWSILGQPGNFSIATLGLTGSTSTASISFIESGLQFSNSGQEQTVSSRGCCYRFPR